MDSIKWHVRSGIYGVEWRTKVGISCQRVNNGVYTFYMSHALSLEPVTLPDGGN